MDTIEYEASMGKINLSDEMITALKGLPIEEQAKRFCIEITERVHEIVYGERCEIKCEKHIGDAEECPHVLKWIVKDGIIVGIVYQFIEDLELYKNYSSGLVYGFLNSCHTTSFRTHGGGLYGTHESAEYKLLWKTEEQN